MTSGKPSIKGVASVIIVIIITMTIPYIFPAAAVRDGHVHRSFARVSAITWAEAVSLLLFASAACSFALFRGNRPDRVLAVIGLLLVLWFGVGYFFA